MAFHHCVHGKSWLWLFLLGPAPFAFLLCFSAGWRSAYLAGGSAFRPLWFVCVFGFLCWDLPTYMTTGVHVDLILTCFFSCKDRASERYRPHRRKKKVINNLANLSWMEVNEMVNFACNHKAGRASTLSGWKKIFACG